MQMLDAESFVSITRFLLWFLLLLQQSWLLHFVSIVYLWLFYF